MKIVIIEGERFVPGADINLFDVPGFVVGIPPVLEGGPVGRLRVNVL